MNIDCKEMTLLFNDFVINNEEVFFSSACFNGLFRANINTGKSKLAGRFPDEDLYACQLHCKAYKYKNRILFVPSCGRQFDIYNLDKGTFECIPILQDKVRKENFKYFATSLIGKYLYIFGYRVPQILRIDMECLEIKYYEGWLKELYKLGKKDEGLFFGRDICVVDNSLFVISGQNNSIVELNMESDQISIHPIGNSGDIFDTITCKDDYLWLTAQTGMIIRVNRKSWECNYNRINDHIQIKGFFYSINMDKEIWFIPNCLNNILKLNDQDLSMTEMKLKFNSQDKWYPNTKRWGYSIVKKSLNNTLAIFCAQDCSLHWFDNNTEIGSIKFYTEEGVEDFFEQYILKKWEQEDCFDQFIKFIPYINTGENSSQNYQYIGKKIHELMKQ